MARTVDSPIDIPRILTMPGTEIVGDFQRSGTHYLARALNTIYEQNRRGPIDDWANGQLLNNTGQTAHYRCRTQGYSDIAEKLKVYFYIYAAGGGTMVVTATSAAGTAVYTYPGGSVDDWFETAAQLDVDDDAEFVDIDIAVSSLSGMSTSHVLGISSMYARDKVTLEAVGAGLDCYANSGIVPLDVDRYDDKFPLSTERVQDLITAAIRLQEMRQGQIVSAAWPVNLITDSDPDPYCLSRTPLVTACETCTARFYVYGYSGGGSVNLGVWDTSSQFEGGPKWRLNESLAIDTKKEWHGPLDLEYAPVGGSGNQPGSGVMGFRFVLPSSLTVEAISGWWRDTSYG